MTRTAALRSLQHDAALCLAAFEDQFDYVVRSLRRHGLRGGEVEDLAQDVFLVLWRRWPQYDRARPLRPWLAGIIFRVVSHHRRRVAREVPPGILDPAGSADPEESLSTAQTRHLVLEALAALPERHRSVLILHELDELPVNVVAEVTSAPLSTVYSRLAAGRQAFAQAIDRLEHRSGKGPAMAPALLLERERPIPAARNGERRRLLLLIRALAENPAMRATRERWQPGARSVPSSIGVAALLTGGLLVALMVGIAVRRHRPSPPLARSASIALGREPASYWRFDGVTGSRVLDRSGRGFDCTVRSPDPGGNARSDSAGLAFNGGWVECPRPVSDTPGASGLTIAAWVQRSERTTGYRAIVNRQLGSGPEDQFFLGLVDDSLVFHSHLWGGNVAAPLEVLDGQWFHVAAVHDKDGRWNRLFVNGEEVGRARSKAHRMVELDKPIILGAGVNGPDQNVAHQHFHGAIAELAVYDRGLGANEIRNLADGGRPPSIR
jgi:RNA polymerase sigma-70 factor (ECF subfamily)